MRTFTLPEMSYSMEENLFFILAGGRGERLAPLTDNCPKPLVRFGSSNRIIDFTLYNCLVSAGKETILLTQYLSEMIEEYIMENWKRIFEMKGKHLRVVNGDFSGTADAVYQTLSAMVRLPKHVVVLCADHIYRMDYRSLIQCHSDHGRTATVCAIPCDREQARRFGIINAEQDGTIRSFYEKPQSLEGIVPPHRYPLASMGIYVFSTVPLLEYFKKNQQKTSMDFGFDILPDITESRDAIVYTWESGYWRDIGDLVAYKMVSEEFYNGQHKFLRFDDMPDINYLSISS